MRPPTHRTLCIVTPTGIAFALAGACTIDPRGAWLAAVAWLLGEAIHRALFVPPRRSVPEPVRLPLTPKGGGRDGR